MIRKLVVVSAVVVAAAVALSARESREAARLDARFGVIRASVDAPAAKVTLEDGRSLDLSQLKGEVVFVNFWATWCPPCVAEMPSMLALGRALTRQHPGKFRMVAVSIDEGWNEVREFFRGQLPTEAVVALDPQQQVARAYYCAARGACPPSMKFPETYVLGRDGRLAAYLVGPRDWDDPDARRFLEQLISDP